VRADPSPERTADACSAASGPLAPPLLASAAPTPVPLADRSLRSKDAWVRLLTRALRCRPEMVDTIHTGRELEPENHCPPNILRRTDTQCYTPAQGSRCAVTGRERPDVALVGLGESPGRARPDRQDRARSRLSGDRAGCPSSISIFAAHPFALGETVSAHQTFADAASADALKPRPSAARSRAGCRPGR
jgi:hypothetical protein